jgi:hypothetical protein
MDSQSVPTLQLKYSLVQDYFSSQAMAMEVPANLLSNDVWQQNEYLLAIAGPFTES